MNAAKNIIISGSGADSVYYCDIRDAGKASFHVFSRYDGTVNFLHTEEYALTARHGVWPSDNSTSTFRSAINFIESRVETMNAREIRIYRPSNPVDSDFCVSVQTCIGGRYAQLFGGLYSECWSHASDAEDHNGDMYMEYIRLIVPVPEDPESPEDRLQGGFFRVSMYPVSDLVDTEYAPSVSLSEGHAVFAGGEDFRFGAEFVNNPDGIPCISVSLYGTPLFGLVTGAILELCGSPEFREGEIIFSNAVDIGSDDARADGICRFFVPLYVSESEGRYRLLIDKIEDISQKGFGTYDLDWENVPQTLTARVRIETDSGEYTTNTVPIDKDALKYILGKSSANASVAAEFPESWKEYKDNYMLNINIVNEMKEDVSPRSIVGAPVSPSLIYKPVFFKVSDTETVNLIPGLTQRVGMDLREYETKVSLFRIAVGELRFIETERTGAYVIFKIDASRLTGDEARYHLLDQDSNYITSGRLTFG